MNINQLKIYKKGTIAVIFFMTLMAIAPLWAEPLDIFTGKKGKIDIAGGTAHIRVMVGVARKIMDKNRNITITVAGGGSGGGVRQVGEGLVDIGNTGRPLREEEIKKYGLVSFPFAIDGVAVVVHPRNMTPGLTGAQLENIFLGKITNWKDVGGSNAQITLYVREDGSGTREVFESKAMGRKSSALAANVVNSNGAMKTALSRDKNSIGYLGIGHLDASVKGLVLDGIAPTQENAVNGTYQISRLLYMNTKSEPKGLLKDFIDYIYSPDGTLIIQRSGYIPTNAR